MELILSQAPFQHLQGELLVSDRTPSECYKLALLQEVCQSKPFSLQGMSAMDPAVWLYPGQSSAAFTVGAVRRQASVRVEGPLLAQLPAAYSSWTMDEAWSRAACRLRFEAPCGDGTDAVLVRDGMVLYRKGYLTWILGQVIDRTEGISLAGLELAAAAAVALSLGVGAKEFAAGLRRFRASALSHLEKALPVEVVA